MPTSRRMSLLMTALPVGLFLLRGEVAARVARSDACAQPAACPTSLEAVGRLGGYTTAFTTSAGFAYIAIGRSVRIVDARPEPGAGPIGPEGTELFEAGWLALPDEADDLAAVSGTLLVALGSRQEIRTFDVRDPAATAPVGSLTLPGAAQALAVHWPVAFVGLPDRLVAVDIADPARMRVLAEMAVSQIDVDWMVLRDGLLFAPGGGMDASGTGYVRGLRVFDVRDPLSLRDLGGVALDPDPNDIAFVGDVADVAAYGSGVRTYDMSDPLHPEPLGVVEIPRGGLHYVVSDGRFAYGLGDSDVVYVADVREPSRPVPVDDIELPGEGPYRPVLEGDRLSLGSNGAIHVLDVADPPTSTLRAAFHTVGSSEGGIAARAGRAYVGTVEGLRSIDVRDPVRPRDDGGVLERFPPIDVQIVGSRAYVAGGYFVCCGTVSILDLAEPAHPQSLGTVLMTGNPFSMAVREPHLFVSSVDSDMPPGPTPWDYIQLTMYDVSDPAAPGDGVEIPHAGTMLSVAGLIYLFDGELLRVLDVGTDGTPITVSSQAFAYAIGAARLVGDHVYAADSARLHVVDVSEPRSPVVVAAVEGIGGHAMAADGACLFALRDRGTVSNVQVVAVDDPASPRLVETLRGVGGRYGPNGIAADAGRVYLASREQGLSILAPRGSPRPTALPTIPRPTVSPTVPHPTATSWAYRVAMPFVALDGTRD